MPGKRSTKIRQIDPLALHRQQLKKAVGIAQAPSEEGGSPHPTVKVGAILMNAQGREIAHATNRFAAGIDRRRPERYVDGERSLWINCAEQLALVEAAKKKAELKGARLYVTLDPCAVCAGLIVEAGIKEVVVPVQSLRAYAKLKAKWKKSIEIGLAKLEEAGVKITRVDADVERPKRRSKP